MSFKWTESDLKSQNIVDAPEFDKAYNALKSEINGGIDRDNIQNEAIGDNELSPDAFLSYSTKAGIRAQLPLQREHASQGNFIYGKTYDVYGGGWINNTAQKLSKRFIEGMLHIEFNAWYYLNNYSQDSNAAPTSRLVSGRWCRLSVMVDNVVVCESHELWQNIGTIHLVADIPITTGVHDIHIAWTLPGYDELYGGDFPQMKNEPLFYYDGGTILAINRYR
tara:strand:- start:2302 stop:2967 length:666 start_codon:yes stop_codon:yes gene_type:complete